MRISFEGQPGPRVLAALEQGLLKDVDPALSLARTLGEQGVQPGSGATRDLWETLATLASHDLGVARTVEPHLDALAILAEARHPVPAGVWGVFAAEGGPDPLHAERVGDRWVLSGTKPWCSLADRLDGALVTARDSDGGRRLFAVNLSEAGIHVLGRAWHARGLTEVASGPVAFTRVPAIPVGEPGWYLTRPGFWWGGIGVAACWFGGAVGIARTVLEQARIAENPHLLAHLGAIDTLLHACRCALIDAYRQVDQEAVGDVRLLAERVRGLVARSCEEIILRAGHALGPGPLATDASHAKRIADLQLYIRQHHAERDDAAHGALLTAREEPPW